MSVSSDSAEQIVRLSLEGMEEGVKVVAKITGVAAKNIAVALYAIMKDQKKTKGKTRLSNMIKSEKELKIFSIKKDDLKVFHQEAKSYGILYCAIVNRRNKNIDDMVDIMVKADHAPMVNRIVKRYKLCAFDKASIESQFEKMINKEDKDLQDNVPDIGEEKVQIDEAMIDDIFAKPNSKGERENQNPEVAKTEKSPPSEHSSMSKNNSKGVTKTAQKPSVRKKLEEAKAEQKVELELRKAQKSKETVAVEIPNKSTVNIPTTQNKERGK